MNQLDHDLKFLHGLIHNLLRDVFLRDAEFLHGIINLLRDHSNSPLLFLRRSSMNGFWLRVFPTNFVTNIFVIKTPTLGSYLRPVRRENQRLL